MVAADTHAPCCSLQWAGPNLHSLPLSPKNLYLLHDAWKHTVFSYNFTWPLTPSAQMQYDPSCHHPFWPVEEIQWIFIMLHVYVTWFGSFFWSSSPPICLGNTSLGTPKWRCWAITKKICSPLFSLWIWYCEIWSEICIVGRYILGFFFFCLFVCFLFFTFDDNSNRIVTGRFPASLLGKVKNWILVFYKFWPSQLKIWHFHLLKACMCSDWFYPTILSILPIFGGSALVAELDW